MTVFILLYAHRHGSDVSVYASRALAEEARSELIDTAIDDWDEEEPLLVPIRAALATGQHEEAAKAYDALQATVSEPEQFEIEEKTVVT